MNERQREKVKWQVPVQEPPAVPMAFVIALLTGALIIFSVASLATWVADRTVSRRIAGGEPSIPQALGAAQINIVNQQQFPLETRAQRRREDQARHLHSYGWVDRERGVIHIPISRAMDLVVEEQARERGGGAEP